MPTVKCRRAELKFLDVSLNGKCVMMDFSIFIVKYSTQSEAYVYVITQRKCSKRKGT